MPCQDASNVRKWLDDQSKDIHGKLDGHAKKHDNITKLLDTMPDHDTLMKGVRGLLADHIHGALMELMEHEKVLLQAIENMQEAVLGQTLEAIEKLKKGQPDINNVKNWLDEHSKNIHGKLDSNKLCAKIR